ncbi:CapA family protein [Salinicoccus sp. YB14-2]|uniref:CapA family protein n=1 Tax=Salinicoccus sp. YB14-2 TaxID=1572701 RepID=UPI00068A9026|nr:CapA family protein [Salinicoccus sp. YB14-2]
MKRTEQNKNSSILFKILVPILLLIVVIGAAYGTFTFLNDDGEPGEEVAVDGESENSENDGGTNGDDPESDGSDDSGSEADGEAASESETTEITISTVGDIMAHDEQYWGAYVEETDSYDFKPVFEHVKPYLEEADLAIGNFETTVAGEDRGYTGYPLFNTPDAIVEGVEYAGFDSIVTSNNHSLDMGAQGIERTVQKLEEADMDVVGTYEEAPEERHVIKDVNGIKVALLAFTESMNGMDDPYTDEEVHNMIDVISEENLTAAIDAAKADDPDIILTYMHWGPEHVEEPGDSQKHYAQFLADQGVDLIIGSHPHVLQRGETIESSDGEHEAFVAYSLGNFVSNQRLETIGEDFQPNEDGVIMHFDIEKDTASDETTVADISYTPTWVYRHSETGERPFDYEILPVEDFQGDENLPDSILERLDRSLERTNSRLNLE